MMIKNSYPIDFEAFKCNEDGTKDAYYVIEKLVKFALDSQ